MYSKVDFVTKLRERVLHFVAEKRATLHSSFSQTKYPANFLVKIQIDYTKTQLIFGLDEFMQIRKNVANLRLTHNNYG